MFSPPRPTWLLGGVLLILLMLTACEATLTPEQDPELVEEVLETAEAVDRFWQDLARQPEAEREYQDFAHQWGAMETRLANLRLRQEIRPLNEHAVEQAEIALELWRELREQHRDEDDFQGFEAKQSRQQFHRIFVAMARGERARTAEE